MRMPFSALRPSLRARVSRGTRVWSAGGACAWQGGAIMAIYSAALDVTGSTFRGCSAGGFGGALFVYQYSSATITSTVFEDNKVQMGGTSFGGAISMNYGATVTFNGKANVFPGTWPDQRVPL